MRGAASPRACQSAAAAVRPDSVRCRRAVCVSPARLRPVTTLPSTSTSRRRSSSATRRALLDATPTARDAARAPRRAALERAARTSGCAALQGALARRSRRGPPRRRHARSTRSSRRRRRRSTRRGASSGRRAARHATRRPHDARRARRWRGARAPGHARHRRDRATSSASSASRSRSARRRRREWYNFGALNFPADHPAMDMHDTLYLERRRAAAHAHVAGAGAHAAALRAADPHPRPGQRVPPRLLRRVARAGVRADRGARDRRGHLASSTSRRRSRDFARRFFGSDAHALPPELLPVHRAVGARWTSSAVDGCGCTAARAPAGSRSWARAWCIPPCSRPRALDSERYTGWAFGMGPARIAMSRYGLPDIRLLYDSDVRFLEQFADDERLARVAAARFVPHDAVRRSELRDLLTAHVATVDGMERAARGPRADRRRRASSRRGGIPNSDHLWVTKVDDGSGELLDVVCGAPNVTAGAMYPFARVGTMMPGKGGIKIEKRKIRGSTSQRHALLGAGARARRGPRRHPGARHRRRAGHAVPRGAARRATRGSTSTCCPTAPTCCRTCGIAREIAALTGVPRRRRRRAVATGAAPRARRRRVAARREATRRPASTRAHSRTREGCPRYMGVGDPRRARRPEPAVARRAPRRASARGRSTTSSTRRTTCCTGSGSRCTPSTSRSSAEPTRRRAPRARRRDARHARRRGRARSTREHDSSSPTPSAPMAVAGVMGGRDTEVTEGTTRHLRSRSRTSTRARVRATRRGAGLSTDASYRFERGVDPAIAPRRAGASRRQLIVALAGGTVDGARDRRGRGAAARCAGRRCAPRASTRVLGARVDVGGRSRALLAAIGFRDAARRCRRDAWTVIAAVVAPRRVARGRPHRGGRAPARLRRAPRRAAAVPAGHRARRIRCTSTARRVRDALVGAGLLEVRPLPFVAGGDETHVRVANPLAENEPHLRRARARDARAARRVQPRAHAGQRAPVRDRARRSRRGERRRLPASRSVRVGALVMGARRPPHFTEPQPAGVYDEWDAKAIGERVARVAYPGRADVALAPADDERRAVAHRRRWRGARARCARVALDAPVVGGAGVRRRARRSGAVASAAVAAAGATRLWRAAAPARVRRATSRTERCPTTPRGRVRPRAAGARRA